jgi:hypothetical protein
MSSLTLKLDNTCIIYKAQFKKSSKLVLKMPFEFSWRVPNNIWQMLFMISLWKICLISTSFPSSLCLTTFYTIYAISFWHLGSKLLSLVFVKSFVMHILWSRCQWSPYGAKTMSNQSKHAYFLASIWGLDTKSTWRIFNTSMAILAF